MLDEAKVDEGQMQVLYDHMCGIPISHPNSSNLELTSPGLIDDWCKIKTFTVYYLLTQHIIYRLYQAIIIEDPNTGVACHMC